MFFLAKSGGDGSWYVLGHFCNGGDCGDGEDSSGGSACWIVYDLVTRVECLVSFVWLSSIDSSAIVLPSVFGML